VTGFGWARVGSNPFAIESYHMYLSKNDSLGIPVADYQRTPKKFARASLFRVKKMNCRGCCTTMRQGSWKDMPGKHNLKTGFAYCIKL
jgi:hypothetical protein